MSKLNTNAALFTPSESFEIIIKRVLSKLTDYYIKGGQAFNYYLPHVETDDYDLVATKETSELLYHELIKECTKKVIYLPNGKPEFITSVSMTPYVYRTGWEKKEKYGNKYSIEYLFTH